MKFIILFGGNSFEHEISIVSAITIKDKLEIEYFIFLDSDRKLYLIDKTNMKSTYFSQLQYKKSREIKLTNGGFSYNGFLNKKIIDGIVINLIHGQSGEDGQIASVLDFYNINYIGPRIEASVISFNKALTKVYANQRKVKTLDYQVFTQQDKINNISFPVIIKPLRLGSSIGISIVNNQNELDYALDNAFEFDNEIIIEPFITNVKEYNLAGFKTNDGFILSIIEEVQKDDFLDFDKKYLDFSNKKETIEARISDELANNIKNTFIKIYDNYFEGSLIRCDFFVIEDDVYLNEINPIPGSMASYLFSNFSDEIKKLSINLPKRNNININYKYISKIQASKGK